ncbi:MAG: hypothetical protein PHU80_00550 [Kiritimatiellae bacterium]|nr:hypothetical protein [Kiritimatiellia bacterium]
MARGPGFASLVFVESANQVVGGADVQPSGRFAFQDVHEIHGDVGFGIREGWWALLDSNQ